MIFFERCNQNTKIRKPRTKKIRKVSDDIVVQTIFYSHYRWESI
jgi:hypothetical protein